MSNRIGFLLGSCAVGAILVGAVAGGCGGVSPGEYRVFRVSITEPKLSAGCFGPNGADPNVKSDSSTYRGSATFILYASTEDRYFLDQGSVTLEGTADGDDYAFTGKSTDIDFTGPDATGNKITATATTTLDMTVDGAAVSGKSSTKIATKCAQVQGAGQICPTYPTCTNTFEFIGTEIEDVELDWSVDQGAEPTGIDPTTGASVAASSASSGASSSTGGQTECSHCSQYSDPSIEPVNLCAQSEIIHDAYIQCVCGSSNCNSVCLDYCDGYSAPDANCQSCLQELCSQQQSACVNDY